ncbi:MAG: nucleotidyltransferase family protein [Alistipes sp.]|nr:nucleotidyltransferase family protein [Alistipes sp.]
MAPAATIEVLFSLLRVALHPERKETVEWREQPDWQTLYQVATGQGVSALVWDGISRLRAEGQIPMAWDVPRALKLQWAMQVEKIEKKAAMQLQQAARLSAAFAEANIRTVVLKGFALAACYPVPKHRECGDLDCFLCGDYERGNRVAEEMGAAVERDFYKHSHIRYGQLMVENHQFCTAIRGLKERKLFEQELQRLVASSTNRYVEDTSLEIPSPDFNALFVTAHGMSHFLSEGLKLRHLCDWMLLLKQHEAQINWSLFYKQTDSLSYTHFAETMTALAVQQLGLSLQTNQLRTDERHAERILEDILWGDAAIYNRVKSVWKQRIMLIVNRVKSHWKYRLIYRRSMLFDMFVLCYSFLFERTPKLS